VVAATFLTAVAIAVGQGQLDHAVTPIGLAILLIATAAGLSHAMARFGHKHAYAMLATVGAFMTADLSHNTGPNGSTALPLAYYDVMKPDSTNDTIT
ncbi:hypothetical protein ABTL25_19150, partial [Acinetobacter baumannii]